MGYKHDDPVHALMLKAVVCLARLRPRCLLVWSGPSFSVCIRDWLMVQPGVPYADAEERSCQARLLPHHHLVCLLPPFCGVETCGQPRVFSAPLRDPAALRFTVGYCYGISRAWFRQGIVPSRTYMTTGGARIQSGVWI